MSPPLNPELWPAVEALRTPLRLSLLRMIQAELVSDGDPICEDATWLMQRFREWIRTDTELRLHFNALPVHREIHYYAEAMMCELCAQFAQAELKWQVGDPSILADIEEDDNG